MALAPDELLITNGCIEALNLALRAVAQPGDTVAVESPTFYGLLQVLESLGLRALEIPTSPQTGLSIGALELAIQTYGDIKAVVVVPHLQNPHGQRDARCHKQSWWRCARRTHRADRGRHLQRPGRKRHAAARHQVVGPHGNVMYCASLHKILAPGLRLGWITAGAGMRAWRCSSTRRAATTRRCRRSARASSWAGRLRPPPAPLRERLHVQREQTADAIAQYFPEGTRINLPNGGLQLWVELPKGAPRPRCSTRRCAGRHRGGAGLPVLQRVAQRPLPATQLRLAVFEGGGRGAAAPWPDRCGRAAAGLNLPTRQPT
jgi:DNA-binding transcriptional MocR family regulator